VHHALFSLHRYKSLARHVWQLVEAKDRSVRSVVEILHATHFQRDVWLFVISETDRGSKKAIIV